VDLIAASRRCFSPATAISSSLSASHSVPQPRQAQASGIRGVMARQRASDHADSASSAGSSSMHTRWPIPAAVAPG
jgi:hypothetical protein